LVRATGKYP